MVSALDAAKRVLVALIHSLALLYKCCVDVSRESSDQNVAKGYRTLSRKVHPEERTKKKEERRRKEGRKGGRRGRRRRRRNRPHLRSSKRGELTAAGRITVTKVPWKTSGCVLKFACSRTPRVSSFGFKSPLPPLES